MFGNSVGEDDRTKKTQQIIFVGPRVHVNNVFSTLHGIQYTTQGCVLSSKTFLDSCPEFLEKFLCSLKPSLITFVCWDDFSLL